jgi:hypothetical protein
VIASTNRAAITSKRIVFFMFLISSKIFRAWNDRAM